MTETIVYQTVYVKYMQHKLLLEQATLYGCGCLVSAVVFFQFTHIWWISVPMILGSAWFADKARINLIRMNYWARVALTGRL